MGYHASMLDRTDTPVLFCNFNRPQLTSRVLECIRQRKPSMLLLACDGPRPDVADDAAKVQQTREILNSIDWPCDVRQRFLETNAGCKHAIADAITWAFEQTERLIVLEDDCLPDPTFFDFCGQLLDRYESDPQVMMIGGVNFQPGPRSDGSYYFSRWPHIWGWATWKEAWSNFDVDISSWPEKRDTDVLKRIFSDSIQSDHWTRTFDTQHAGAIDTWDFPWTYAVWENDGFAILPQQNLVKNIGFGASATHTVDAESKLANMSTAPIEELVHPNQQEIDVEADAFTWENIFLPGVQLPEPVRKRPASSLFRKLRRLRNRLVAKS